MGVLEETDADLQRNELLYSCGLLSVLVIESVKIMRFVSVADCVPRKLRIYSHEIALFA